MSDEDTTLRIADDVCGLTLVRRLAALLDRDPATLREGDPLPRGWHPLLFNPPTRQSALRHDGAADLGAPLPELGLPRLMLGGRRVEFAGDIPIGARLRRETRRGEVQRKRGRSGEFALVGIEHRIFVGDAREAVLTERQDYVLRAAEASGVAPAPSGAAPASAATVAPVPAAARAAADAATASSVATGIADVLPTDAPVATRTLVADEALLFRYSAITDNPHRIHYDHPYATGVEGYPALVVNGSIPTMFLLEMFRTAAEREPRRLDSRNLAPMFSGRPLALSLARAGEQWRLWVTDDQGRVTFDARAD